jgi:arylsulfatase A-like enzyme
MSCVRETLCRAMPALALALLLTSAPGCSGDDEHGNAVLSGRNVVVVLVDTLRADHLGFHDYARDTSPFLDTVAAEGVVFDRAVSNSSFTRESVSTLLTGRLPSMSGSMGWHAAPSDHLRTLGNVFKDEGYRTGFFTTTIMLGNPKFTRGFDVVDQLVEKAGVSGMSHELTNTALAFVRESPDDPFMMYVHYFDPHGPYDPSHELKLRFTDAPHPDPVGLYTDLRPRLNQYLENGFAPGEERFEDMVLRYDAEIVDVDDAIRDLFAGLEELGVADDTLVVLTSDHGEEFLDHGNMGHAWAIYDESIQVPLVFWAPGVLEPARVSRPASVADIAPTLTALLDLPAEAGAHDGRPLFDAEGGQVTGTAPIVTELLIQHRNVLRAVTAGDWKYIQARRWLTPAERMKVVAGREQQTINKMAKLPFDPWSPVVREELFNLADDPDELVDLSGSQPVQLERMRSLLADFESRSRELGATQQGTAEELSIDAEMAERIRSIGY